MSGAGAGAATALAQTPVDRLKGVGPALRERLAAIDIHSVEDLLFHLPSRYQDRTQIQPIDALLPGQQALVEGEISSARINHGRRRSLILTLEDGSRRVLSLRLFHFSRSQQQQLAVGTRLRCYAEARRGPLGLEMVHPEYHLLGEGPGAPPADSLTPIYPTTEGLHQLGLRKLSEQALALLARGEAVRELLPPALLERHRMPPLAAALQTLHRPPSGAAIKALSDGSHPARRRLAFEELLAHRLSMLGLRDAHRAQRARPLRDRAGLRRQFVAALPFALTAAQARVIAEIERDLGNAQPMLRLVQGDVGSGKTVVAAAAAAAAVAAGAQVALMAPTEILAEQHHRAFSQWFEPLGVSVGWLSGRLAGKARGEAQARLRCGELRIAIGTHALIQDDTDFAELALVIIDEQHRFGVAQRAALRDKSPPGQIPHQLVMTATPIPRTLAMTSCADLDYSAIDELPPGRQPITTVAIAASRRAQVIERVAKAVADGRQIYWVCTLIDESESLAAQAASESAAQLAQALPGVAVGLVHGRLGGAQKDAVMAAFKAGEIQLLVATTVIEVGVDVPAASLMIIENPERLGLSQLHQLRGRVGRGSVASTCLLLYEAPLGEEAHARLQAMRDTQDGFELAERDLALRGAGDVFGTRQTGLVGLRCADLIRDRALMPAVIEAADELRADWPERVGPLIQRWLGRRAQEWASV